MTKTTRTRTVEAAGLTWHGNYRNRGRAKRAALTAHIAEDQCVYSRGSTHRHERLRDWDYKLHTTAQTCMLLLHQCLQLLPLVPQFLIPSYRSH